MLGLKLNPVSKWGSWNLVIPKRVCAIPLLMFVDGKTEMATADITYQLCWHITLHMFTRCF